MNEKMLENGDMVTLSQSGDTLEVTGMPGARLLVMSGVPLHQSVVQHGPFVMNTREEIIEAFEDLRAGKMGDIE